MGGEGSMVGSSSTEFFPLSTWPSAIEDFLYYFLKTVLLLTMCDVLCGIFIPFLSCSVELIS